MKRPKSTTSLIKNNWSREQKKFRVLFQTHFVCFVKCCSHGCMEDACPFVTNVIQLFREKLSFGKVKTYETKPIVILGSDSSPLFDRSSLCAG